MISIIMPTYNEEERIGKTIAQLKKRDNKNLITEIIVADGGSSDNTLCVAGKAGAVSVRSPVKGRAAQMNYGASLANGAILYFLHADTIPPNNFTAEIIETINEKYCAGCFNMRFDHEQWFLQANAWFTRFD